MIEQEVKFLDVDPKTVREKLLANGWKHYPESMFSFRVFDYPDRRIQMNLGLLRLRKERGKNVLAFKQQVMENETSEAKQMKEIEVEVSDYEKTTQVLEEVGFGITREIDKKRESFEKNGIHVDVDTYPPQMGVPPMLEIEAKTVDEMKEAAKELGFDWKDAINWNGWKVFEHYGIDLKNIKEVRF